MLAPARSRFYQAEPPKQEPRLPGGRHYKLVQCTQAGDHEFRNHQINMLHAHSHKSAKLCRKTDVSHLQAVSEPERREPCKRPVNMLQGPICEASGPERPHVNLISNTCIDVCICVYMQTRICMYTYIHTSIHTVKHPPQRLDWGISRSAAVWRGASGSSTLCLMRSLVLEGQR